jgi:DnaJ-domain-containing protein 1
VIELTLQLDGSVTGRLIASFQGLSQNTNLASLTLSKLAEILVALREAELVDDADLLEAYLEAVDADWRAKIAEEIGVEDNSTPTNPWTVLGLTPGASLEEVKQAYRKIMRTVHPDTSGLPQWYAQTVNHAYRQLLEELTDG